MARRGTSTDLELEKRATTIMTVLAKLASFVIWLVALTMALNEMTFNVQPLLASLGVAGLALGVGTKRLRVVPDDASDSPDRAERLGQLISRQVLF